MENLRDDPIIRYLESEESRGSKNLYVLFEKSKEVNPGEQNHTVLFILWCLGRRLNPLRISGISSLFVKDITPIIYFINTGESCTTKNEIRKKLQNEALSLENYVNWVYTIKLLFENPTLGSDSTRKKVIEYGALKFMLGQEQEHSPTKSTKTDLSPTKSVTSLETTKIEEETIIELEEALKVIEKDTTTCSSLDKSSFGVSVRVLMSRIQQLNDGLRTSMSPSERQALWRQLHNAFLSYSTHPLIRNVYLVMGPKIISVVEGGYIEELYEETVMEFLKT